jgi:hypothetical protein
MREVPVTLPAAEPRHDVLAALWARRRIDDLMAGNLPGAELNTIRTELREQVTQLALDFRLMTQFTSFVAVEEVTITEGGRPRRVEVPVQMPEGVSYEGVFGEMAIAQAMVKAAPMAFTGGFAPRRMSLRLEQNVTSLSPAPRRNIDPALLTIRSGKVRIQVALADASAAYLAALKKLGFELLAHPHGGRLVIGNLDAGKLQELARLPFVRYVGRAA